ncbi:MAG TPA: DNA gyrase modulator, partial [Dissulfurispiraceae bacterium]
MDTKFAERLLELAMAKGADEAEVFVKASKSLVIEVRERRVDTLESSRTAGYGLRVIKDRRLGFSYSTELSDIENVAEQALSASLYTEPDEHLGLPSPPHAPGSGEEVRTFDDRIPSLPEEEAVRHALS